MAEEIKIEQQGEIKHDEIPPAEQQEEIPFVGELPNEPTETEKELEAMKKRIAEMEKAKKAAEEALRLEKSNAAKAKKEKMTVEEQLAEREKEIAEREKDLALRKSKSSAIECLAKLGFVEADYDYALDNLVDTDETITNSRMDWISNIILAEREKIAKQTRNEIFKENPQLSGLGKGKDSKDRDGFTEGANKIFNNTGILSK